MSMLKVEGLKKSFGSTNVLKGIVTVAIGEEDKTLKDYSVKEVKILKRNNRKDEEKINMAELKGLED